MAAYPGILGTTPWPFGSLGEPFWQWLQDTDPHPEGSAPRPDGAGPHEGGARPEGGEAAAPRVAIELFISPDSATCAAALRNIERALAGAEREHVRLEICDVSQHPGRAADAHVCFTPTLVIRATDQPPIWIFGALTDTEVLTEHLEVAGVPVSARGN